MKMWRNKKFHWMYLRLEVKRLWKSMGYILGAALFFLFITVGLGIILSRGLYKDQVISRVEVGVVQGEEEGLGSLVVGMMEKMKSVESFCDFIPMDEEEAKEKLRAGKLFAVMIIPKEAMEGIMDGRNIPITILLPKDQGIESGIFKDLTKAGATTLGSAQAGVYAVSEFMESEGMEGELEEAIEQLNKRYLELSFQREENFQNKLTSATGTLTIFQYYLSYGLILFLLLCGIPCGVALGERNQAFDEKRRQMGISNGEDQVVRILSLTTILLCILMIISVITGKGLLFLKNIFSLLPVLLGISSIINWIYGITANSLIGGLALFLGTVGMVFCSGGFLPPAFLPSLIKEVLPFIPTTILANQIGSILSQDGVEWWKSLGVMAVFLFLSFGVERIRQMVKWR